MRFLIFAMIVALAGAVATPSAANQVATAEPALDVPARLDAQPLDAVQLPQQGRGLDGYIGLQLEPPPPEFTYGVSFYTNVWSLVGSPLSSFQIGLPSTWITPDNGDSTECLCPVGTLARDQDWCCTPARPDDCNAFFQTIEGGGGFWNSTRFGSPIPKFRINGTPNCYNDQISSPGWGFGATSPLDCSQMGLAQLSRSLLIPPDGLTFRPHSAGGLLGTSWMSLPLIEFQGWYRLQTRQSIDLEKSFEANHVAAGAYLGGASYMAPSVASSGQRWRFEPNGHGQSYMLSELPENEGKALEGNRVAPESILDGAAFMAPKGAFTGEYWKILSEGDDFQLTTVFVQKDGQVLDGNNPAEGAPVRGAAYMADNVRSDGQLWVFQGEASGDVVPTGDQSWTLFLNAENFSGPVAFWIPNTWSRLSASYAPVVGRGLDARGGLIGSGAMEFNSVPMFSNTDGTGVLYSRIPQLLFPIDSSNKTVLMQDVLLYSREALYAPVRAWLNGDAEAPLRYDMNASTVPTGSAPPLSFTQGASKVPVTGFEGIVETTLLGGEASCAYGLSWSGSDAKFPAYFRQQEEPVEAMVAVDESQVPGDTHLAGQVFAPPLPATNYTSPDAGCWSTPGPASGTESVRLTDGSIVTYAWYRFVDQPSIAALGWDSARLDRLQQVVEQIHASWSSGHQMPQPSLGSVVELDPALLVTPPAGMEVGYVPIVVAQEVLPVMFRSGSTVPGDTAWQPYSDGRGIYVDVDTTAAGFAITPVYLTSLGGDRGHWSTTGATSIYEATKTGFRVYVRWANGNTLTPRQANDRRWHINWVGIQE